MPRQTLPLLSLPLAALPAAFLAVASCSTARSEPVDPPVHGGAGLCADTRLAQFAGQPASQELGARIMADSGATSLRWVNPGMMVTMEYRADRVTVHLDSTGRVERAVCG